MKHYQVLLLFSTLATLFSCGCDDCGEAPVVKEPYFINQSGSEILFHTFIMIDSLHIDSFSIHMNHGDTLHRQFSVEQTDSLLFFVPSEEKSCGLFLHECDVNSVTIRVEFIKDKKCLIYSGETNETVPDMRLWSSFSIKEDIPNYDSFVRGVRYELIIDTSYYFKATECM